MINFKVLLQTKIDMMTEVERKRYYERKKLEQENIFYETTTMLGHGKSHLETQSNPKIKKMVYVVNNKVTVQDKMLLDFGGYWCYEFDKDFIDRTLSSLKEEPRRNFYLDLGQEIFVKNKEMIRVIEEGVNYLIENDIQISEDNSIMEKMLFSRMLQGIKTS